jgi:hypothetical protein
LQQIDAAQENRVRRAAAPVQPVVDDSRLDAEISCELMLPAKLQAGVVKHPDIDVNVSVAAGAGVLHFAMMP